MEETVKILRFEAGDSIKTLKELRDYISAAKDNLAELTIGSEAYNEQLKEVQTAQDALKDSMNMGVEGVKAAKGSYNDLVHTMRDLKQAWRATSDEAERDRLGKQINTVNSQLKQWDASVGNYSRNVGNYSNSIQEAFAAMGGTAGKAAGGLKTVTAGLKAMSATPVIAIIGAIVSLLGGLIKALKSSESGLASVTSVMGIFSGLSEGVTIILQKLGGVLGQVANKLADWADKLGLVNEKMKEKQRLAQEEIQLARDSREASVEDAEAKREISDLRAKAVDKEKYNYKERQAFLKEAQDKEEEIFKRRKDIADRELALIVEQNKNTENSAEVEDAIAQAKVKSIQAETAYNQKVRQNTQERMAIRNEEASARKQAASEAARAAKERTKAEQDALNARLAAERDYLKQEASLLSKGSEERYQKELEIRAKELEIAEAAASQKIKNQEELNKQLTILEEIYQKDIERIGRDFTAATIEEERKRLENRMAALTAGTEEYLEAATDLRRYELETLTQKDGETETAFQARRIAAEKAVRDALREEADKALEEEHIRRENRLAALQEDSMAYLQEAVALKEYELDTLHQLEGESNDAFRARELAADKALTEARKALAAKQLASWQGYASGVSGLATSLAGVYEDMSKDQEKAAESTKSLRIGAAIIDTIGAAIVAYKSGVESGIPAPGNLILGALQAATVTATGLANVAKIRSTSVKGGGGSSVTASVAPPAVIQQVPVTRSLTSATEEERLDRMSQDQRVYLVYDDVRQAGKYVDVVQEESSF